VLTACLVLAKILTGKTLSAQPPLPEMLPSVPSSPGILRVPPHQVGGSPPGSVEAVPAPANRQRNECPFYSVQNFLPARAAGLGRPCTTPGSSGSGKKPPHLEIIKQPSKRDRDAKIPQTTDSVLGPPLSSWRNIPIWGTSWWNPGGMLRETTDKMRPRG
jgi:hypothetical protein